MSILETYHVQLSSSLGKKNTNNKKDNYSNFQIKSFAIMIEEKDWGWETQQKLQSGAQCDTSMIP